MVIGGGNVAVDAALTALRCGAEDVKMVCLEGLDEMPANAWEIEGAKAEGVQILPCWRPDKIISEGGKVTGMPGVYAGGDIAKAPGAVIHAIAAGRRAAASIDRTLGGSGDIDEVLFPRGNPNPFLGRDEGFATFPREIVPELDVEIRIKGFQEIASGYSHETAVQEAGRCLQCDLRLHLRCNPPSPAHWLPFDEEHINQAPETEGAFQLLDGDHQILNIKGTANLRQDLLAALEDNDSASFFEYEEDKMFSQRESELIQKYLQEHGGMPDGDADDLF